MAEPDAGVGDTVALDQTFARDTLYPLRRAVSDRGTRLGLDPEALNRLVIVVSELATNAVRHGGGAGRLRIWAADGYLCCEVRDAGTGIGDPDRVGTRAPDPEAISGRGMWIVRRLAAEVRISNGDAGTVVTVTIARTGSGA